MKLLPQSFILSLWETVRPANNSDRGSLLHRQAGMIDRQRLVLTWVA